MDWGTSRWVESGWFVCLMYVQFHACSLEIKKIAEEKNIQRVERQIELEASNQLAT